jgi:hypothetical protein
MLSFKRNFSGYFLSIFALLATSVALAQAPTPTEYPRQDERRKMLELVERVMTDEARFEVSDMQSRPEAEKAFLEHFIQEIFTRDQKMTRLNSLSAILKVAADRALYNDAAEKEAWLAESDRFSVEASSIGTSSDWKEALRKGNGLAQGLIGTIPDMVRKAYQLDQLSGFAADQMPKLELLTKLETVVSQKANESKVTGQDLATYQRESDEIEKQFRGGQITYQEATAKLDDLWPKGFHAKGADVGMSAREELGQIAILRTQLANSKGFSNWAEYQMATAGYGYAEGFKTVDDHINFLSKVLEETLPTHHRFKPYLATLHPNVPIDQMEYTDLLVPETETMVADYFPVESVNEFWMQTMRESGFPESAFANISLDSFPREGKQTHAYMWNVVSVRPKIFRVQPGTLNSEIPSTPDAWSPAMIYIVQNARKDGLDAYSTVFHEGGHALDYVHRKSIFEDIVAYAYTETASMTMERFFRDLEFLVAKGRKRDGTPLSREVASQYLKNIAMLEAVQTRGQIFNALFDFLIWREAYKEGGANLVDRMLDIYDELRAKYFPGPSRGGPIRGGYRMFSTGHFTSGHVRYFGYIYADMGSQMTADFLWDGSEEKTGVRTLLNKPELACKLIRGQYEHGFCKPFPQATEEFTGRKLDPSAIIQHINAALPKVSAAEPRAECETLLKKD